MNSFVQMIIDVDELKKGEVLELSEAKAHQFVGAGFAKHVDAPAKKVVKEPAKEPAKKKAKPAAKKPEKESKE
jgi:hypothetical protein